MDANVPVKRRQPSDCNASSSPLIDGVRNYVVIRLDHVTTYPPQKAAREIVCATPDKCV